MILLKTVLIVQHQIVRDGIKKILDEELEICVSYSAAEMKEVPETSLREASVLILDFDISDLNASKIIVECKEEYPEIEILVIGTQCGWKEIKNIRKAGASGFLFKEKDAGELIKAVKKIAKGEHYFCDKASKLISQKSNNSSSQGREIGALTEREYEILVLICEELTNREIGEKLHISVRTVDAHRRNILQKTGAKNTAGLVKYAFEHEIYPG